MVLAVMGCNAANPRRTKVDTLFGETIMSRLDTPAVCTKFHFTETLERLRQTRTDYRPEQKKTRPIGEAEIRS